MHDLCETGAAWSDRLWRAARERWTTRKGQDRNFRRFVIHPALGRIIRAWFHDAPVNVLDLGCGDGVFLDDEVGRGVIERGGTYTGLDIADDILESARSRHNGEGISFICGDLNDAGLSSMPGLAGKRWDCILSVFAIQEVPRLDSFCRVLYETAGDDTIAAIVTVHPDFAQWLYDNGSMAPEDTLAPPQEKERRVDLWRWAGHYPIVDEPGEPFYLPYFHRTLTDYRETFERHGFIIEEVRELPESLDACERLTKEKITPFVNFDNNVYWPRMAEAPSAIVFTVRKSRAEKADRPDSFAIPSALPGMHSYEHLREHFLNVVETSEGPVDIASYGIPEPNDAERVTYIIPPVTEIEHRRVWNPGNIYVVRDGVVAIGRVSYTRTSGEFLIEELILRRGDIFGEFEVPLSLLGSPTLWNAKLPPRFNMTYGAWASGPALNWAMAYPRYIPRDSMGRGNPKVAMHPFYIKSKDIRPHAHADVFIMPIEHFENMVRTHPEAMTWFLMNVLWKNRLYFEQPSQGYGRLPADSIARLMIRLLAYRIRLGIVVHEGNRCSTFLGPAEWLKHGLGSFSADLMDVVRSTGASMRETVELPLFEGELSDIMRVTWHVPVKDLEDPLLLAMGCRPGEDRHENRYGLLSGIRIDLDDLDAFKTYLLERGE